MKNWTYSNYRATLRRNGKFFALVTPDGKNALAPKQAKALLKLLNAPRLSEAYGSRGEPSSIYRQSGAEL